MDQIRKIKGIVSGSVVVPTHKINLTDAIEAQRVHRENGDKVIKSARAYEEIIAEEIAKFFTWGGKPDLKDLLKALIIESSHLGFMGKIQAYRGITRAIPKIDPALRKEVIGRLLDIMNLRNAHTHGTLSTQGNEVYLKYYRNGMKEELLDDRYWEKAEEAILGLTPLIVNLNYLVREYLMGTDRSESDGEENDTKNPAAVE